MPAKIEAEWFDPLRGRPYLCGHETRAYVCVFAANDRGNHVSESTGKGARFV